MTNGEKMRAVFPDIKMWGESKGTLDYSLGGMVHRVMKNWWNAGYKEPSNSGTPNRWIPVSERLPEQGQEVICQCRANIIKALKLDANFDWYQDADHCYMSGFVIAWMPLPDPYAESEE